LGGKRKKRRPGSTKRKGKREMSTGVKILHLGVSKKAAGGRREKRPATKRPSQKG